MKKAIKKIRLGAERYKADLDYWMSRPPAERIEAVELLRKEYYGSSARLQPRVRIIKLPKD